jgi:hypothetical protein
MASNKKVVSSRQPKSVHDKKRASDKTENKSVLDIFCKCGERMTFFGVDGNGGLKFSCPRCYERQVARIT